MKILFLTSRFPYPPHGGDKLRVFNFIKYLSERHSIHLISFIELEREMEYVEPMRRYCADIKVILLKPRRSYLNCILHLLSLMPFQVAYYRDKRMAEKLEEAIAKEKFDAVYVHLLRMAQYARETKGINKILDLTDSLSLSLKRSLSYRGHLFYLFYLIEWLKINIYESDITKYFNRCLLISDADRRTSGSLRQAKNISILANGVDLDYFKPTSDPYNPSAVTFFGNLHSFPNRDAVLNFCRRILPIIRKEVPNIKLFIVGANPPDKIKRLGRDTNIIITGPVEDARPYLTESAVLACPIRVATGMQNKILEAMAMGLPIVSTSIATQWLEVEEDNGILVADTPVEFAKRIISIIKDRDFRHRLSLNARKAAVEKYSWQKNIAELESILKKGVEAHD